MRNSSRGPRLEEGRVAVTASQNSSLAGAVSGGLSSMAVTQRIVMASRYWSTHAVPAGAASTVPPVSSASSAVRSVAAAVASRSVTCSA